MTVLGALKREKKYMVRFPKTEVINVNLPPNESIFDFQEDNLDYEWLVSRFCLNSYLFQPELLGNWKEGNPLHTQEG